MIEYETIERRGFGIAPELLSKELRQDLVKLFDVSGRRAGFRFGLGSDVVQAAASSPPVCDVVAAILGEDAFAVKATLFDKHASSNWLVPWHQDVVVPVRERLPASGFDAWSIKDGVVHARPPVEVLQSMIAVRLDLDGSSIATGSLRVFPETHQLGVLSEEEIRRVQQESEPFHCLVPPLGAMVMRPLLLHASSRATAPDHRRIVHLEFASRALPEGVEWAAQVPIRRPPD